MEESSNRDELTLDFKYHISILRQGGTWSGVVDSGRKSWPNSHFMARVKIGGGWERKWVGRLSVSYDRNCGIHLMGGRCAV